MKSSLPTVASNHSFQSFHSYQDEQELCKSLQNVSANIKKFEDLVAMSEEMFRKERQMDRELYFREQQRQLNEKMGQQMWARSPGNYQAKQTVSPIASRRPSKRSRRRRRRKTNRITCNTLNAPSHSSPKRQHFKIYSFSPHRCRSRLYFRNGKIGCIDIGDASATDHHLSSVQKTHAIVRSITENADIYPISAATERTSFAEQTSGMLSEESSLSFDNIPTSRFNFELSLPDSDDPMPTEELLASDYEDIAASAHPKSVETSDVEKGANDDGRIVGEESAVPFHIEVKVVNEQPAQDGDRSFSGESMMS